MILTLILLPALFGVAAMLTPNDRLRRGMLLGAAVLHSLGVAGTWVYPPAPQCGEWLKLDPLGQLFLSITSVVFLMAALYAQGYLPHVRRVLDQMEDQHTPKTEPESRFTGCLLLFLSAMTLITVSNHFGLLWVAVETSTLASAPLIYFHRTTGSLRATWKYLMVCSVGVAIALMGNFFLAVAVGTEAAEAPLRLDSLLALAPGMNLVWLKAAFIFFLVGYGTKMGLAPMHNWLPDAHSESPSLVSALLSGALLNCAFLGILRALQVCIAAGIGDFSRELMVLFGLVSMIVALFFLLGQADFKRMLAYSSVEHMGILSFGVGLGGNAVFGAMLHAINHSFTKAMMFFVAGNILNIYRTKSTHAVHGVLHTLPRSGWLWMAGFLAIAGSPPFGVFISEFTILRASFVQGRIVEGCAYLALLSLIFIAMATIVLRMAQGPAMSATHDNAGIVSRESWWSVAPPALLGALVLLLGVMIPEPVRHLCVQAMQLLGGRV